jgi:hypothetical protein
MLTQFAQHGRQQRGLAHREALLRQPQKKARREPLPAHTRLPKTTDPVLRDR